jgi:hypothetical protein
MIDIGPTAAAILGLRFENAEGTPMAELIKPDLIPPAPPKSKKKKEQPAARSQEPGARSQNE